jgi:hypothetical protein
MNQVREGVDAASETLRVNGAPEPAGHREAVRVTGTGTVSPSALPDLVLRLAEISA